MLYALWKMKGSGFSFSVNINWGNWVEIMIISGDYQKQLCFTSSLKQCIPEEDNTNLKMNLRYYYKNMGISFT